MTKQSIREWDVSKNGAALANAQHRIMHNTYHNNVYFIQLLYNHIYYTRILYAFIYWSHVCGLLSVHTAHTNETKKKTHYSPLIRKCVYARLESIIFENGYMLSEMDPLVNILCVDTFSVTNIRKNKHNEQVQVCVHFVVGYE